MKLALIIVGVFAAGVWADRTLPFSAVKIGVLHNIAPKNGISISAWDHNCVSHFAILTSDGDIVVVRDEGPDSKPCLPAATVVAH